MRLTRLTGGSLIALLIAAGWLGSLSTGIGQTKAAADPALERTRDQVRMLDDLYKNVVVFITDKYVHKDTDVSAGTAAVTLFSVMKKNGWHDIRLVDATNQPFEEKNSPKDAFEKAAVKAIKGGKTYHEEVVKIEGKPHLRAATPVPVVMKKCVMCHPHYADVKEGEAIGILSYIVPIK